MFECVIASAAKQSRSAHGVRWIASSQGLLAMTGKQLYFHGLHFESDSEEHRPSDASQRIEATAGPAWFFERCEASCGDGAPCGVLTGEDLRHAPPHHEGQREAVGATRFFSALRDHRRPRLRRVIRPIASSWEPDPKSR